MFDLYYHLCHLLSLSRCSFFFVLFGSVIRTFSLFSIFLSVFFLSFVSSFTQIIYNHGTKSAEYDTQYTKKNTKYNNKQKQNSPFVRFQFKTNKRVTRHTYTHIIKCQLRKRRHCFQIIN